MAATSNQIEALRLIADWSKWIAALSTGAIAALAALLKPGIGMTIMAASMLAMLCFVVSIASACVALLSLPAAVQDMAQDEKVWDRVAAFGPMSPPLWRVVTTQLISFTLGSLVFGVATLTSVSQPSTSAPGPMGKGVLSQGTRE